MAIWRSTDLEVRIGGLLDATGITERSIAGLVADNVQESEILDFKTGLWTPSRGPRPSWTDDQEFAKDIAAFANYRGGLVIIGVEEVGGAAVSLAPLSASIDPDAEERRLRQALLNYQAPLANCEFVWVRMATAEWLGAIVVPPGPRSPHAVLGDRGDPRTSLRYPVRHGAGTDWLSEHEVAERYHRRLNSQKDAADRLRHKVIGGGDALFLAGGVWLYAALVPEAVVGDRLDRAAVELVEDWFRGGGQSSPMGRYVPALGRGIPAPNSVRFTGSRWSASEDETTIRDAYVELNLDGSAYVAVPVGLNTTGDASRREVGELTLVDDCILLLDLVLRWATHRCGTWGAARLVVGFVDAESEDGALAQPISLVENDTGELRRVRRTRRLDGHVQSASVVDLAAVGTLQNRLSVTHLAVSGLLQWFGLAEPNQLLRDGTIVPNQFTLRHAQQVEQWAIDHGVAH